jgi:hypothetical protein
MTESKGRNRAPIESFIGVAWVNRRDLASWDLIASAFATLLGVWLVSDRTLDRTFTDVLMAEVAAVGALFGFVVAGLAIVVAFLDERFLRVIRETETGVVGSFWPFWLISALAVTSMVCSGTALLLVGVRNDTLDRAAFGVTTFFALWALLGALRLVQFIVAQGLSRAGSIDRSA